MVKDFFREKNDPAHAVGSRGSIRQAILLVLLLLTAGLGYLYFFTGLIRPREHIEISTPPATAPVKQPLPPRMTEESIEQALTTAKEEEKAPPSGTEEKSAPVPPPDAVKEAAKPAAPPTSKPLVKPTAKPSVVAAAKKAASPAPKPATTQKKPQSVKGEKAGEKPAVLNAAKNTIPKQKQAATQGKYALLIGSPAGIKEAEKMRTRLMKEGIKETSIRKIKKTETMHRIFLGEFESQAKVNSEFNQLKTVADGAFVLRENGRYQLYAGSYLQEGKAKEELKRLAGKGLKPGLRSAKVSITMNEVLAGSFPDSNEAQKEADRLKKKGIGSKVIKTGQ